METTQIIVLAVLIFFVGFAACFEYGEQRNAYLLGEPKEKDSIVRSLSKVETCLTYDLKTIKWRRTLIAAAIAVLLIFGLIHGRVPNGKELLLHFVFIFLAFYIVWQSYVHRTSTEAVKFGKENIANLKQELKDKRSFVFPW